MPRSRLSKFRRSRRASVSGRTSKSKTGRQKRTKSRRKLKRLMKMKREARKRLGGRRNSVMNVVLSPTSTNNSNPLPTEPEVLNPVHQRSLTLPENVLRHRRMMSNISVQTMPPVVIPTSVQVPVPTPFPPVPTNMSEPELSEDSDSTELADSRSPSPPLTPDMIYPRKHSIVDPIRMTGDMIMRIASVPQQSFVLTT